MKFEIDTKKMNYDIDWLVFSFAYFCSSHPKRWLMDIYQVKCVGRCNNGLDDELSVGRVRHWRWIDGLAELMNAKTNLLMWCRAEEFIERTSHVVLRVEICCGVAVCFVWRFLKEEAWNIGNVWRHVRTFEAPNGTDLEKFKII